MPRVQAVNGTGTATATPNATITVTAGNFLIVIATMNDTVARTLTGISDGSNTYHQIAGAANSNGTLSGDMWWAQCVTGGTLTVTLTVSAATCDTGFTLLEVSSLQASPLDVAVSANGSSTAPATGNTGVTALDNEFVVAAIGNKLNATPTGKTFSPVLTSTVAEARSTEATAPIASVSVSDGISGAAGNAQSFAATMTTGPWVCMIACFKPQAADLYPPKLKQNAYLAA